MFSRRGAFIELLLKNFEKKSSYSLIHRQGQGWFFMSERIALKNDEKWWSNHISIIVITNFRILFPCRKVPLMISWEWLWLLSLLILCFLGAVDLLNFFLKILGKKFARSFDLPPRSKLIFYVWVNSPEKMMKNGGRIIFLSSL